MKNGKIKIKKVAKDTIQWLDRIFRYQKVLNAVKKMKIGEAIEVNIADAYMVSSVRNKCHKAIKGNYRIKGRIDKKAGKTYICKTAK
jgi:hypothetical protein